MPKKGGNPQNLVPIKKGEVRNPYGRPRVLPELKTVLTEILSEEITNPKTGERITQLEAVLRTLNAKAMKGDMRAIQEILDRTFGKSHQSISVDDVEPPKIIVEIVDPKNDAGQ